jgi:hypothetical protein
MLFKKKSQGAWDIWLVYSFLIPKNAPCPIYPRTFGLIDWANALILNVASEILDKSVR